MKLLLLQIIKKKQVIYESADLIFHLLVLWKKLNIKKSDIAKELLRRKNDKETYDKNNIFLK